MGEPDTLQAVIKAPSAIQVNNVHELQGANGGKVISQTVAEVPKEACSPSKIRKSLKATVRMRVKFSGLE